MILRTATFLSDLQRARSLDDVWSDLTGFSSDLGLERTILGFLRYDPDRRAMMAADYRSNLPDEPMREYVRSELYRHDPVYRAHYRATRPIACHSGWYRRARLTPEQRRVFETAFVREAPFRVVMPAVFFGERQNWACLLGGSLSAREGRDIIREGLPVLWLAASAAMWRLAELAVPLEQAASPLTPRERECLTRLAAGDRVDRIADRLRLSNATVELHLANARRKVGARTSPEAVAKAVLRRWIEP